MRATGGHDFSIGLDGDGGSEVEICGKIGDHPAGVAEARIQSAIGLIAGESKIGARLIDSGAREARDHNPAVHLQGHGSAVVSVTGKVGQHFAVSAEGGIEIAGSALGRFGNKGGEKQTAGDGYETHSGEERCFHRLLLLSRRKYHSAIRRCQKSFQRRGNWFAFV